MCHTLGWHTLRGQRTTPGGATLKVSLEFIPFPSLPSLLLFLALSLHVRGRAFLLCSFLLRYYTHARRTATTASPSTPLGQHRTLNNTGSNGSPSLSRGATHSACSRLWRRAEQAAAPSPIDSYLMCFMLASPCFPVRCLPLPSSHDVGLAPLPRARSHH